MSSNWLFFKKRRQVILKNCYNVAFQTKDYFSLFYYFNNHDFIISVIFLYYLWLLTWVYCW